MGRPRKIKVSPDSRKKNKAKSLQSVRGMVDILPTEQKYWDYVVKTAEKFLESYSFKKLLPPVLERTELFARSIGSSTDIVEKEMFTFEDKGGDSLTLRPEWTAGVMRAYIEHGLWTLPQPIKAYSFGPVFRHERPQAGRWRQFYQINAEIIGIRQPVLDAEMILLPWEILQNIGLKDIEVKINSLGCDICRPNYREALINYLSRKKQKLCDVCKRRLKKNPLRVLDCKEEKCQAIVADAPQTIDHLCEDCHNHFKQVLEYLDESEVVYDLSPKLVRGLDYYTKTVFEIWPKEKEGRMISLAGGGRYDDLIESLGGKKTPSCGMSLGVERIIEQLKAKNIIVPEVGCPDVLFVHLGELAKKKGLKTFSQLVKSDINIKELFHKDSIQNQLRVANSLKVKYTIILGQKEVLDETVLLRNMSTGVQEVVNKERLVAELKRRLDKK